MTKRKDFTRSDVVMAYRLILGRPPESDGIVEEMLSRYCDFEELRQAFLACDEFRGIAQRIAGHDDLAAVSADYFHARERIDVHVEPDVLGRLFDRTREQWTLLGDSDPFYSVLTNPGYRSDVMDAERLAGFRATGQRELDLIDTLAGRDGVEPPHGTCIELGCGVGRVTRFLADKFDKVIAVDISPGNLRLAREYMQEVGIENVEFILVGGVEDFASLPAADYFYSLIALQHNSPPLQYHILDIVLGKIRPGGSCLFQTVADAARYGFDAERYLESDYPEMEVHCLPMPEITRILRQKGFDLLGARLDPWTGFYGSYTFTAQRTAGKKKLRLFG